MNGPLARSSIFAHSRIDITLVRAAAAQLDVPFYYFSKWLSSLTGYFESLNGKPNVPIAWGASAGQNIASFTNKLNRNKKRCRFTPAAPGMRWVLSQKRIGEC